MRVDFYIMSNLPFVAQWQSEVNLNTNQRSFSVVVPVYGCRDCLDSLCEQLDLQLAALTEKYEIILVDDRSQDNSWETLQQLQKCGEFPELRIFRLSRNFGQHYAISAGLDQTRGCWVVVMDCDLQDQPEEIEKLYNQAQKGFDIVLGSRVFRQDSFMKRIGSRFFYFVLSVLTGVKHDPAVANFGIYNHKVIESIRQVREQIRYFPVMISSRSTHLQRLKRLSFLSGFALLLLLSGCGKRGHSVVLVTPLIEPTANEAPKNTTEPTPTTVDTDTEEEERALTALSKETPDEEMSREDFLKIIHDAKTVAPAKITANTDTNTKPKAEETKASPPPKEEQKKETTTPAPTQNEGGLLSEEKKENEPVKPSTDPEKPTAPEKPETPPLEIEEDPLPTPENIPVTDPTDVGIDAEDEEAAEAYTGPTSVVDRPRTTDQFQLSETAARLGAMNSAKYRLQQKDAMGTSFRACNFFLITALVESGITDEKHLPLYQAALFDSKYFEPKKWKKIKVATLKEWFANGKVFDVVLQRNPPKGKSHGHVAIPVGLNETGQILVAEGVYKKFSNRIRVYTDSETEKYNIYVRTAD